MKNINEQLSDASKFYNIKEIKKLISRGADIDSKDKEGYTPLILSISDGYFDIVELLLNNGADINLPDNRDRTPLMHALMYNKLHITELLLKRGADINTTSTLNEKSCFDFDYADILRIKKIQKLIITTQPHNVKLLDDNVGILPHLKQKYKDGVELATTYRLF